MKNSSNFVTLIVLFSFATTFLFSCYGTVSETRTKNIGPYTFAGLEFKTDLKRIEFKTDSLRKIFAGLGMKSTQAFGIFREQRDKQQDDVDCMLGLILEEEDKDKIEQLKQKGFIIQEMGVTNSIFINVEKEPFGSFVQSFERVGEELKNYIENNDMRRQPLLCIFSKKTYAFSMEAVYN